MEIENWAYPRWRIHGKPRLKIQFWRRIVIVIRELEREKMEGEEGWN